MAINQESFNTDLYRLLRTRGYKPVPKDAKNQRTQPEEAEVFNFTFTKDGKDYGDAWVTIDEAQNVVLYYNNEQEESPSGKSPNLDYDDSWSGLKRHLKQWSMNKQLSFELRNKDELGDDMAQRDYVKKKEKMNEAYHPMGRKASYNDNIPAVKIILQHNRQIEEGEQRYRNIAKIFLENQDGERFLAPTTRPGIAQVYARHIAEGGVPNDERWNHIKAMCEDYSKMAGFVRATKNKQFNESAQSLVNEGINHYQSLRETLGKLRGHRGYNQYFESWTPALMEDDTDGTQINELFVQETVDPRIESVMPILSRLHKKIGETQVKEVSELAEWADSIVEGEGTLEENSSSRLGYIKRLKNFDWYYDYGDDADAQRGYDERKVLLKMAKELDPNFQIWNKIAPDGLKMFNRTQSREEQYPDYIQEKDLEQCADSIVEGETLTELGDSDEDKLSPSERKEREQRNKKEYEKNLKATPDAIKKKLNLPDNIDEGEETLEEGTSDLKLPAGFFKAGRGIEAWLLKQSGKMPSYHAAMSDRHLEYARRANKSGKQEERDFHTSQHKHHIDQMLSLGRSKDKNDKTDLSEDSDSNPVESAIIRRIVNVRMDLLKHGIDKVTDAVKEVASYVGDVDEIGSSDVSGWIRQVERILSSQDEDDFGDFDADFVYGKSEPVDNVDINDFGDFGDDPRDEDDSKFSNESLDKNQKKAGQLGPTEKVGKEGAVGKLVGANESIDPLDEIKRLIK